jgi:integrase
MKLSKLFQLYQQEKPDLSPATLQKYDRVYKLFIHDTDIDNIFVDRIECIKWRNVVYKRASAVTANNYHRHMKALFGLAVVMELIEENPFKQFKLLIVKNIKSKVAKTSTIEKLKSMINSDTYYSNLSWFYLTMIAVFSYSAVRRRQLIGIKWRDINFSKATLYLAPEFSKNKKDNLLPLNSVLIKMLINFKREFKDKCGTIQQDDQVFNITKLVNSYTPNHLGETTENHISGLFTRFSKKIGEKITPHRFRHAFASIAANRGCNLQILSQFMSHSDIQTTAGYVETDMQGLRNVQNMLSET